jgi:hypothetical protein
VLSDGQDLGREVRQRLHNARGPFDAEQFHLRGVAETEMGLEVHVLAPTRGRR